MKMFSYTVLASLVLTSAAFANPTVNSPSNGSYIKSPFTLSASSATCASQSVSAMAYSIDSGTDLAIVNYQVLDAQVSAATGTHTIHVKAWGIKGAGCDTDISVNVITGTSSGGGNPSVSIPINGSKVISPFTLSAKSSTCSSQSVSTMSYSIDGGVDLVTVNSQALDTQVSAATGIHILHVKSWGNQGAGCSSIASIAVTGTTPSGGNPSVNSPLNGATVSSPFSLSAISATCSSQSVSAIAYSIDSGADLITVNSQSLNTQVSTSAGAHSIHVKSWGNQGAECSTDITVNATTRGSGSAEINIGSPFNGETVNSPFTLSATASTCLSQPVSAIAYSIDSGANATTVNTQSLDAQVMLSAGGHTIHVKSWGNQGAGCLANIDVTVSTEASSGPYIPSNAISVSNIQTLSSWKLANDPGNNGWSSGTKSLVSWPSHTGTTMQTVTKYSNAGGERYWVTFGDDTQATNFVYDAWVYLANTTNTLANLEMDMNQVMPNGQTAIYGFECDGYSKTWDYTMNAGTPSRPVDKWMHSNQTCDMNRWSQNTWHHVQIEYSRNDSGVVTYKDVYLDGIQSPINATVPSAFALGWGPSLLTNFQVDGLGSSGQVTVYVDNISIYRW